MVTVSFISMRFFRFLTGKRKACEHYVILEQDGPRGLNGMAEFCTAANDLPGLAEFISGLCENFFDPLLLDYNQGHHKRAISLAAPRWQKVPRDSTRNTLS